MFFFLTELIYHLQYFYNFWFSDVFREVNKKTSDMKWVNALKLFALSLEAHEASPCPLPISTIGHLPDWREWIPSSVDNQKNPDVQSKLKKIKIKPCSRKSEATAGYFPLHSVISKEPFSGTCLTFQTNTLDVDENQKTVPSFIPTFPQKLKYSTQYTYL